MLSADFFAKYRYLIFDSRVFTGIVWPGNTVFAAGTTCGGNYLMSILIPLYRARQATNHSVAVARIPIQFVPR